MLLIGPVFQYQFAVTELFRALAKSSATISNCNSQECLTLAKSKLGRQKSIIQFQMLHDVIS